MNDRPFRRSIYFTLVMSSVCLGYSEWDYLPEVTAFTGVVVLAMVAAFILEGRGRHLTLQQSNLAGAVIFTLAAVWIGSHYMQSDSLMHTLPWPAGGLPFLAPLLMLLIPAKLFRPKRERDWWGLYCISLACVGLAMSLAEELFFMLLVLLYAATAVWSLTHFYRHRLRVPTRESQLGRSLRWLGLAAVVSLPIFFLTPRTAGVPWELFNAKLESGMPTDGSPDLSRTGTLKPSRDVAFEVNAINADGSPRTSVPSDQRWRVAGYTEYQSPRGRWAHTSGKPIVAPTPDEFWGITPDLRFPELGPDSYRFDFRIVGRTGGPVFADPVFHRPGQRTTIAVPLRRGFGYGVQFWDASFVLPHREFRFTNRYIQLMPAESEPSAFALSDPDDASLMAPFLAAPPQGVIQYAHTLLRSLLQSGQLPARIAERGITIRAEDAALVAEAFSDHLSNNSAFSYSLELRRKNKSLDPIEDFLINTRSGHCERYASALVLLLRGVGVPAQLVLGYRGCEQVEPGRYLVRQDVAHAWAEVLLPQDVNGQRQWIWQTFDPTPASSAIETSESGGILESSTRQTKRLFSQYVINLNPDTQQQITEGASEFFKFNWPWLAATPVGIMLCIFAVRTLRQHGRARVAVVRIVPWYARLVAMLHDAGLPEVSGETPKEWGQRASAWLHQSHPLCDCELPNRAAATLYRLRFAECAADDEVMALESTMQQLATSLTAQKL